jgi:parallel beta-helix repeat protein
MKKHITFGILLVLFASLALVANAQASTYYVSPTGSDTSDGLGVERALMTIQRAVDLAQPGDTVVLGAGEYREDVLTRRNGSASAPITITGPSGAVVRGGGNPRIVEVNHDYITLSGFTINGLFGSANSASGYRDKLIFVHGKEVRNGVTGLKVLNMSLLNAGGECVRLRYFVTGAEIAYNTIQNCGAYDFKFNQGGKSGEGIYVGTSNKQWGDGKNPTSDADITRDNRIHHNTIDTQGNECVDIKEGATANIVENNTCSGQKDPESGGFDSRGDGNTFRYNTVTGSVGAGIRLGGWLVGSVQYGKLNDIYGNTITNNKNGGIRFQVSPQGKICENQMSGNTGGDAGGEYGAQFDPVQSCSGGTVPPTPPTGTPPTSTPPTPRSDSLVNNGTLIAHSNNFSEGYEPSNLWDGCYEGGMYDSTTCTAGGRDIQSFWLEFDLARPFQISQARLYGDTDGTWTSTAWTLQYKQNAGDGWVSAFVNDPARTNGWVTRSLAVTARYIRIEVKGDTSSLPGQTQARELEVFGVPAGTPTSPGGSSGSGQSSGGGSYGGPSGGSVGSTASSIGELIAQLRARVALLQSQLPKATKCVFLRSLALGSVGEDVRCLQQFLNIEGFPIATTGPGSLGSETPYFGLLTKRAVAAWQSRYATQVLVPFGLSTGTGFWGRSSIAYYGVVRSGPL